MSFLHKIITDIINLADRFFIDTSVLSVMIFA